jgi:hypothetical protein
MPRTDNSASWTHESPHVLTSRLTSPRSVSSVRSSCIIGKSWSDVLKSQGCGACHGESQHAQSADRTLQSLGRRRGRPVRSRSPCGPFASPDQRTATNTSEHSPREAQRSRGLSPVLAGLRGSLTNRGERLELAFLCGFRAMVYGFATAKPAPCRALPRPKPRVCHDQHAYVLLTP